MEGISESEIELLDNANFLNLSKTAIKYSDGIIFGAENINKELNLHLRKTNKPILEYQDNDDYIDTYSMFYDQLLTEKVNV